MPPINHKTVENYTKLKFGQLSKRYELNKLYVIKYLYISLKNFRFFYHFNKNFYLKPTINTQPCKFFLLSITCHFHRIKTLASSLNKLHIHSLYNCKNGPLQMELNTSLYFAYTQITIFCSLVFPVAASATKSYTRYLPFTTHKL